MPPKKSEPPTSWTFTLIPAEAAAQLTRRPRIWIRLIPKPTALHLFALHPQVQPTRALRAAGCTGSPI